jgi:hypothetical protein
MQESALCIVTRPESSGLATREGVMHRALASETVAFPIRLGLDRMKHLVIVDFDGDPEFSAIEPQRFDDPFNGTGLRILRYRTDGRVDVYWEPGVRVDRREIAIGAGIADFAEVRVAPALFEISATAVHVRVGFTDQQGRDVVMEIAEAEAPGRPFPFLAPVGNDVRDPLRLFLVYMRGFDFVRRRGTRLRARVGDRPLKPRRFPIPRRGHSVYFARYAAEPVIVSLNPPMTTPVVLSRPSTSASIHADGMTLALDSRGAIERATVGTDSRGSVLEFQPPYPNLLGLEEGASARGRWGLSIAGARITGGAYALFRADDTVSVELDVTQPWKPSRLPWSFGVFTWIARSFRAWPTTYTWKGIVRLGSEMTLTGTWRRRRGKMIRR